MDIKDLFNKKEKFEIKTGSRSSYNYNRMAAACNLYDNIKKLEDNVKYTIIKNKECLIIYKKEDK